MTEKETVTAREDQPRPTLNELLEKTRNHIMTPEEKEAQRQSWVRGEMGLADDERRMTTAFAPMAQGEAPQLAKCSACTAKNSDDASMLCTPVEGDCPMEPFTKHWPTQAEFDAYEAKQSAAAEAQIRVEAGAHPSQDAPPAVEQSELSASEWLLSMDYPLNKEYPANVVSAVMEQYAIYKIGPKAGARSTPSLPSEIKLRPGAERYIHWDQPSTPFLPAQDAPQEHASLQQSYIHVFERAEVAEADLARQKTTYLGLLDEAGKEMASLAGEIERLREALRQIADGEFATRGFSSVQSLARAILAAPDPKGE